MNFLFMGMNYAPERTGIAPLTTELCEYLISQGHCVSVATAFPHYPEWKIQTLYRNRLFLREQINGVVVYRGYVYVPGRPNARQRILYDTSLGISTFLWGLAIKDADLIVAIAPPVQLGVFAYILSRLKKRPFVVLLQDLAVDAAVAVGMLKSQTIIHFAHCLEEFVYHRATDVLVICQGFFDQLISRGVPASKISLLSNWVDTTFIRPLDQFNIFRESYGLSDRQFIVLHTGNLGSKQGLSNAIKAAKYIRDHEDIVFLFVGDGSDKTRLMKMTTQANLTNVRFLPLQPRQILPQMLAAGNLLLLNQAAGVLDTVLPSKLLTYMAAGRPVIAAVHPESEAAKYVRWANCGLIIEPDQPKLLADAILYLRENQNLAQHFGQNARVFAEEHFARDRILARYTDFFSRFEPENR
ncbi:MAG TPA: WcaI family glycosyltransferase [Pyrinomonadaceae bacterium]|nr:WcaI family glycosyltransferase [Pyrinomonadaceae bacterium]